jgi:phage terminase small subunit
MGRARKLKNGLTQKQTKFKNIILKQIADGETMNATEAAAIAYDVKDRKVAGSMGEENMKKPEIQRTIQEELEKHGATPSTIAGNLTKLANGTPEKYDASTILKANIEILKLQGSYKEEVKQHFSFTLNQQINNLTFKEIEDELKGLGSVGSDMIVDATNP